MKLALAKAAKNIKSAAFTFSRKISKMNSYCRYYKKVYIILVFLYNQKKYML